MITKRRYIIRVLVLLLTSLLFSNTSFAQIVSQEHQNTEQVRIDRLVALGKLWGTVNFFHPYLAYRDIDWDSALVANLPAIEKAQTEDELVSALQELLYVLKDPVTRVVSLAPDNAKPPPELLEDLQPNGFMTHDSILVITITDYADLTDLNIAQQRLSEALAGLDSARSVVFDLRKMRDSGIESFEPFLINLLFNISGASQHLTDRPIGGPATRQRIHYGLVGDGTYSEGTYNSGFVVNDARIYGSKTNQSVPVPAIFLINRRSVIPGIALALQHSGQGAIVSEGKASDVSIVNTERISITDNLEVVVRTEEIIYPDGTGGFMVDSVFSSTPTPEETLNQVVKFASTFHTGNRPDRSSLPAAATPNLEDASTYPVYPSRAARLLAAFKIWNVAEQFFAYKHLMDEPWGPVLAEFIPKFETASDSLEYALTVSKMVTRLQDGHVRVYGLTLQQYFGEAPAPVSVRFIEEVPVITSLNDSLAVSAGVQLGDEIVRINGKAVGERIGELAPYITASNSWTHKFYVASRLLDGPEGSTVHLSVRDNNGQIRKLSLPRGRRFSLGADYGGRSGDIIRILEDNIGYVDLDRLEYQQVDTMFKKLKDTRGIILDMRGYPKATVLQIAPRLGLAPETAFASNRLPISQPSRFRDFKSQTYQESLQYMESSSVPWVYDRPTVMLIDERTQSQSEHSGLAFAAANGTIFIGSGTAGANGNVTRFSVPGDLAIRFSGYDVHHPNGQQLQRVGLKPDIVVRPTIKGIRSGRDEVLEAAVKYLQKKTEK